MQAIDTLTQLITLTRNEYPSGGNVQLNQPLITVLIGLLHASIKAIFEDAHAGLWQFLVSSLPNQPSINFITQMTSNLSDDEQICTFLLLELVDDTLQQSLRQAIEASPRAKTHQNNIEKALESLSTCHLSIDSPFIAAYLAAKHPPKLFTTSPIQEESNDLNASHSNSMGNLSPPAITESFPVQTDPESMPPKPETAKQPASPAQMPTPQPAVLPTPNLRVLPPESAPVSPPESEEQKDFDNSSLLTPPDPSFTLQNSSVTSFHSPRPSQALFDDEYAKIIQKYHFRPRPTGTSTVSSPILTLLNVTCRVDRIARESLLRLFPHVPK
jgi:hypothetical protein